MPEAIKAAARAAATTSRIRGPLAPVLTPFTRDLEVDAERFVSHCRWLVASGVGLAVFGTNSEAASVSMDERLRLTDALLEAGIDAARMMPGTGVCALGETVTLTRHAVANGAAGVLMLPPYFYKGVSDDGLFGYYSEVIERVGDERLRVYLYHIPAMTQVPISLSLIERLISRYPKMVAGAKDSSGDWNNTRAMIDNFAAGGFDVFPASESLMLQALRIGGAGCISATANVNPGAIRKLYENWESPSAAELHAGVDVIRKIFQAVPMIPGMKRAIATWRGDEAWCTVRPPLVGLKEDVELALLSHLNAAGFAMPNPG